MPKHYSHKLTESVKSRSRSKEYYKPYLKTCTECGISFMATSRAMTQCRPCIAKTRAVSDRLDIEHQSLKRYIATQNRLEKYAREIIGIPQNQGTPWTGAYDYQSLQPEGDYIITFTGGTRHLERKCHECERISPFCGFAPAFSTLELSSTQEETLEHIRLLCNDCYSAACQVA